MREDRRWSLRADPGPPGENSCRAELGELSGEGSRKLSSSAPSAAREPEQSAASYSLTRPLSAAMPLSLGALEPNPPSPAVMGQACTPCARCWIGKQLAVLVLTASGTVDKCELAWLPAARPRVTGMMGERGSRPPAAPVWARAGSRTWRTVMPAVRALSQPACCQQRILSGRLGQANAPRTQGRHQPVRSAWMRIQPRHTAARLCGAGHIARWTRRSQSQGSGVPRGHL